jgi:hypothetical protein
MRFTPKKIFLSSLLLGFVLCAHFHSLSGASSNANKGEILRIVADLPLPGPPVRFDYQSLDVSDGRLYIAHMNADRLVVFDTLKREVVANLDGFRRVHGVIAVPELARIYASVTGDHQVAAVDRANLQILARIGTINYPDGLAYIPTMKRVFVSDEHGNADAVIDANTNQLIAEIKLGGGAGNTVYDSVGNKVLVAVHGKNELVTIDPLRNAITARTKLEFLEDPHGVALDVENRLAFVAGEGNNKIAVVDLKTMIVGPPMATGKAPDVLAFDPGTKLLYVAAESGQVTVFREANRALEPLGRLELPHGHTVAVDPKTHLVYFPLENVDGKPVLRIMEWAGKK